MSMSIRRINLLRYFKYSVGVDKTPERLGKGYRCQNGTAAFIGGVIEFSNGQTVNVRYKDVYKLWTNMPDRLFSGVLFYGLATEGETGGILYDANIKPEGLQDGAVDIILESLDRRRIKKPTVTTPTVDMFIDSVPVLETMSCVEAESPIFRLLREEGLSLDKLGVGLLSGTTETDQMFQKLNLTRRKYVIHPQGMATTQRQITIAEASAGYVGSRLLKDYLSLNAVSLLHEEGLKLSDVKRLRVHRFTWDDIDDQYTVFMDLADRSVCLSHIYRAGREFMPMPFLARWEISQPLWFGVS